jgi:hypothetical protein
MKIGFFTDSGDIVSYALDPLPKHFVSILFAGFQVPRSASVSRRGVERRCRTM